MFKAFVMMKRRPDISVEEFIDYYEREHSRLGAGSVPNLRRYIRHYLTPFGNSVYSSARSGYDVVTEIWFDNEEEFQKGMAYLADPETAAKFAVDEPKLFDIDTISFYTVKEFETDLQTGSGFIEVFY